MQLMVMNDDGSKDYILDPKYPVMETSNIRDIFTLDSISDKYRQKHFCTYTFKGVPVPRVSNILDTCIGNKKLIDWAAAQGYKKMKYIRDSALDIGSVVHEMIEHYLSTGEDLDLSYRISPVLYESAIVAYENFKGWMGRIYSLGYKIDKIYGMEIPVTCPYYGGTIDMVAKINGAIYVIDFKTSKQIDYKYIIQTIAYYWMINNGYCEDIKHADGIGIIRVDKNIDGVFEDLFLNEHIPYQREVIQNYLYGFGTMVNWFYQSINMQVLFDTYSKNYDMKSVLDKGDK